MIAQDTRRVNAEAVVEVTRERLTPAVAEQLLGEEWESHWQDEGATPADVQAAAAEWIERFVESILEELPWFLSHECSPSFDRLLRRQVAECERAG